MKIVSIRLLEASMPVLLFVLVLLSACVPAPSNPATFHHVATDGSDANVGSAEAPFRTVQRAINAATAGDTILVKPGVYRISGQRSVGVRIARSGERSAPIVLRGDGGRPVIDCSGVSSSSSIYCLNIRANWWHISDIEVTGATQSGNGSWSIGIRLTNSNNNILENIATYEHEGPGLVVMGNSSNNIIINCDSYNNYDRLAQTEGGNADGVQFVNLPASATGNRVSGCRSWSNSDDGFDLWQSEAPVTIENSWAFWNGRASGDGNGFKLGRNSQGPRHRIVCNLSFENRAHGFDDNSASGAIELENNTSYGNGWNNYHFERNFPAILRNNISYSGGLFLRRSVVQGNNSWNNVRSLRDDDFRSLSTSGVDGPRQAGGDLPVLPFLQPSEAGQLIAAGVRSGAGTCR